MKQLFSLLAIGLLLAACGPATETPTLEPIPVSTQLPALTETAAADRESTAEPPTETPAAEEETPTDEMGPDETTTQEPVVEEVTFGTEDGVTIAALYYPPEVGPAPGVLLFHQRGESKEVWEPLINQLLSVRPDLALMAIDFPGHGESDGPYSDDIALSTARDALSVFRGFEGVNANRIVIIGASIGADAAVDECFDGCVGAVTVSPGGWLGIPYNEALEAMRSSNDRPILCIASEDDAPSPETCVGGQEVELHDYRVHLYEGSAHGNQLFYEEELAPEPPIMTLIITWLDRVLPPQ